MAHESLQDTVAFALRDKPFTWLRTEEVTPSPQHVDAVARQFGASVVRVLGLPPGPFLMLISRVPIRSIRDTCVPFQKPFRSFRRYCTHRAMSVLTSLTFLSGMVVVVANHDDAHTNPVFWTSIVVVVPLLILVDLYMFGRSFRRPSPTLDHHISALIREFDGRKKVRIYAVPYRLPSRDLYSAVAWELGYTLKSYYRSLALWGGDANIITLTFERHDHAARASPEPAPYQAG